MISYNNSYSLWLYRLIFIGACFSGSAHSANPRIARTDTVSSSSLMQSMKRTNSSSSESADDCHRRRLELGVAFAFLRCGIHEATE
jgi:hypothetical protein